MRVAMTVERITATFEIVTPMFMGGADPKRSCELRVPSIKGALRFRWRALAWSRFEGQLKDIHKEEARLFGSATVGRSSFSVALRPSPSVVDVLKPSQYPDDEDWA